MKISKDLDSKILTFIQEYLQLSSIKCLDKLLSQCASDAKSIWGNVALSIFGEFTVEKSKSLKEKIIKSKKLLEKISEILDNIKHQHSST